MKCFLKEAGLLQAGHKVEVVVADCECATWVGCVHQYSASARKVNLCKPSCSFSAIRQQDSSEAFGQHLCLLAALET